MSYVDYGVEENEDEEESVEQEGEEDEYEETSLPHRTPSRPASPSTSEDDCATNMAAEPLPVLGDLEEDVAIFLAMQSENKKRYLASSHEADQKLNFRYSFDSQEATSKKRKASEDSSCYSDEEDVVLPNTGK